jgi:hypothetical protein
VIRIFANQCIRMSALVLCIASAHAQSQGTVPNHSIPIGRGPGVSGWGTASPGIAGNVLTSNGPSANPSFQPVTIPSSYFPNNPSFYGAVCDGSVHLLRSRYASLAAAQVVYPFVSNINTQTIDWAALQSMANSQIPIKLNGSSNCMMGASTLTWTQGPVSLSGLGQGVSLITWDASTASTGGISITQTQLTQNVSINNVTLLTQQTFNNGPINRFCIDINNTAGANSGGNRIYIDSVTCKGATFVFTGWITGINITIPNWVYINNFSYVGATGNLPTLQEDLTANGGNAISVSSTGDPAASVVNIDNLSVLFANIGVVMTGAVEGINVHFPQLVNVNTGVFLNGSLVPCGVSTPCVGQHTISDGHINAPSFGVRLLNVYGASVKNLVIFQQGTAVVGTNGIDIFNSQYSWVCGNQFLKQGSANYIGVSVSAGSQGTIICGNQFISALIGVQSVAGSAGVQILDNYFAAEVGTPISGDLTHTFVRTNVIP